MTDTRPTTDRHDILTDIMRRQRELQMIINGHDPQYSRDKIQDIRINILAAIAELIEMLDEIPWKPWSASTEFRRDAFVSEGIDVMHFLVNMFLIAGATPDEIHTKYVAKNELNRKRQADGYDGSNKCPGCHRAYDDEAVKCELPSVDDGVDMHWCEAKNDYVNPDGSVHVDER
jgi:dimeric dUTPase (all-alpha-NTP-PPase superfamily)